ncbi:MAG: 2OG-Fe(II) oxygenase [Alphaproteobacteria bacterium]|nr:2OG-Fe(II) oxygenase [Alphaproteobacteria bacterium]
MIRVNASSFDLSKSQKDFTERGYLVIDDFLVHEDSLLLRDFLHNIEEKKKLNDPSQMTPWPWVLRLSINNKISYLSAKKAYPLLKFNRLIKDKYLNDKTNGMYYWFYYLKPCLGKFGCANNNHYYCVSIKKTDDEIEQNCKLCQMHQAMHEPNFINVINALTGLDISFEDELAMTLTRYDQFSFLSPHTDFSSDENVYKLSVIYYINYDLGEHSGGDLKLDFGWDKPVYISPKHNRLILFKPQKHTLHEVLPIKEDSSVFRYAFSGWFSGIKN